MIGAIIGPVMGLIGKAIDKAVPDKDKAAELKQSVTMQAMQMADEELKGAVQIITAEATGESWLQRNWRPLVMLWFAGLVGAHWLGFTPPNMDEAVVLKLLNIVQIGIGGYIASRGVEKTMKTWKTGS